jgi:hypothetical protein
MGLNKLDRQTSSTMSNSYIVIPYTRINAYRVVMLCCTTGVLVVYNVQHCSNLRFCTK